MTFDGNLQTINHWKTWNKGNFARIYVSKSGAYLEKGATGLCNLVGNLPADQIAYIFERVGFLQFDVLFANLKNNKSKEKNRKTIEKEIRAKYGFGTRKLSTEELIAMMAEIKEATNEN
jgi:hypothetical protein